jgi:hypothetical protein
MTTDEKLKFAARVAHAAARSGEHRRPDSLIAIVFRTLNAVAPPEHIALHEPERAFKL